MEHRSVFKQINKQHKSGHSKPQQFKVIKDNTPGAQVASEKGQKDRRSQQSEAIRKQKTDSLSEQKSIGTKKGPPKIIAVLPCSQNANAESLVSSFDFAPEVENLSLPSGMLKGGQFSHRIIPFAIPRNIEVLMDIGKVADIVVLLFQKDEPLDDWGAMAISILKSIGLPAMMAVVASPSGEPIPRDSLVNYRNYIQKDLPDVDRILPLVTPEDMAQFVRFVSVTAPNQICWKANRPSMLIQSYSVDSDSHTIELLGYLRNAPLNVNQIVTIPCVGDFQIAEANGFVSTPELRHPIVYQHGSDADDIAGEIRPPQTIDIADPTSVIATGFDELTINPEEDQHEQQFDDDNDEQLKQQELVWKRTQEELEFPDEFDYDNNVLLRDRLRKYRGLKSFKSSPWNPNESLPPQYSQIFEFPTYNRTSEAAIAEQKNGEIAPGQRVTIKLLGGEDMDVWNRIPSGRVLTMFGLFRNETRFSVATATIHNNGPPLRSKEQLLLVCGFRHLWVKPIFSEDTRAEKHLYLRVIDQGMNACASFISPAFMQTCPISYFKEDNGSMEFIGTGSIQSIDPRRMVIKRIVLTGNPYRASGRNARVSMMFFNKEDVQWFRLIGLHTKGKKRGHIVEPIGLKGRFKVTFNEIVQQDDTVCMSLYKRIFPKLDVAPVVF